MRLSLTDTLGGVLPQMTEAQRNEARRAFDYYVKQFSELKGKQDAEDIAGAVHDIVDEEIARSRNSDDPNMKRIKCSEGCSHCCKMLADAWPEEAALLVRKARERGIALNVAKLKRQAAKGAHNWRELSEADRACVFLDEAGRCRVYEDRPNSCRKHFVLTNPKFCNIIRYQGRTVGRVFSAHAEIIESAARTVFGGTSLAAALLGAMK